MPQASTFQPSVIQKAYAIIVAGGSGTRMRASVPKQFLLLNGLPVLMHTIRAFYHTETKPDIILVMHPGFRSYWAELCLDHQFNIPHRIVDGGNTRFHSVQNAIELIEDQALVAVHDAVRPLTAAHIIDESYRQAALHGNAVTAVKSRDSVRRMFGHRTESMVRDEIYLVQTPQTFRAAILKGAYMQPYQSSFTDDASVAESDGEIIRLIEGNYQNIKITFPEDIAIAELLLNQKATL